MYDFPRGDAPHIRQRGPAGIPARLGAVTDQKLVNDRIVLLDIVLHGADAAAGQCDELEEELDRLK